MEIRFSIENETEALDFLRAVFMMPELPDRVYTLHYGYHRQEERREVAESDWATVDRFIDGYLNDLFLGTRNLFTKFAAQLISRMSQQAMMRVRAEPVTASSFAQARVIAFYNLCVAQTWRVIHLSASLLSPEAESLFSNDPATTFALARRGNQDRQHKLLPLVDSILPALSTESGIAPDTIQDAREIFFTHVSGLTPEIVLNVVNQGLDGQLDTKDEEVIRNRFEELFPSAAILVPRHVIESPDKYKGFIVDNKLSPEEMDFLKGQAQASDAPTFRFIRVVSLDTIAKSVVNRVKSAENVLGALSDDDLLSILDSIKTALYPPHELVSFDQSLQNLGVETTNDLVRKTALLLRRKLERDNMRQRRARKRTLNLDGEVGGTDGETITREEITPAPGTEKEFESVLSDIEIDEALAQLSARHRQVAALLIQDYDQIDIAKRLNLSEARISQIVKDLRKVYTD